MTSLRKELEKREFETLDLFTVSFSLFISNFTNFLILALICSLPLILTSIYFPVRMFDPEKVKTAEDILKWFQNDVTIGFYINIFLSWFLDTLSVIAVSLLVEGLVYKRRKTATWAILKSFNFKKGLIMEDEIQLQLDNGKIEMKIPKSKAMNEWVKENNAYLIEHNHFYNK